MTNNYFKSAWRNLRRNKTFSILNIAGLAVGIACASLIFLWVEYNVTYDRSIPDLNNIYAVENNQTYGKDMFTFDATSVRIKDALIQEFPGVINVSRENETGATVSLGDKHLSQSGAYVDSAFLKMFGLPLAEGSSITALNDVSQIAVSKKLAKSYFGDEDAIGKTLLVDNKPYKVSAIYKDIPQNMRFYGKDFLLPYQAFINQSKQDSSMLDWGNNWTNTWVQLNPNTNVATFNKKLEQLIRQKDPQTTNQSLWLYPLRRMNLYGAFYNGKESDSGTITYVRMFSFVALVILIIACINFMNLSTARSEKRAKEIGMRKVLGSTRRDLIGRLLSESLIVAYVAVIFSVVVVACVLPLFSSLIGIHLQLNLLYPSHILFLIIIGAVCGFVAGSYPALYLSSFNPVRALKNQITRNAGNASVVRKGLVVIQFTVSVIIIISVIVIYKQIQFTKNRDLGFNQNNVLYMSVTPDLMKGYSSLKQSVLNTNAVSSISLGSHSPMAMYANGGGWSWDGKAANEDVLVTNVETDADYLKTFGIQLQSGRGFSQDPNVDSTNIIINESFAKLMGKAGHVGGQLRNGNYTVTIIGITKNFVYNDVYATHPAPLALYNQPSNTSLIFMKLKPTNDLQGVLSKLQTVFRNADASQPFDYHFIDKDFERKFKQQQFVGSLATIFGCLAIFISCLGLLGLSAFMAEQRKKEIGIRKVLGASVVSIIKLLSKDFLELVLLSYVIAFPLAYWMMHSWLQGYEYRIGISWYVFLIAGVLAIIIAFITVSSQAIRAARANPVDNLKTE